MMDDTEGDRRAEKREEGKTKEERTMNGQTIEERRRGGEKVCRRSEAWGNTGCVMDRHVTQEAASTQRSTHSRNFLSAG